MPKAFSIAHGLDWDTEVASFWAWFQDSLDVLEERKEPQGLVQELIDGQKNKIEEMARGRADPEAARLVLETAVAVVGFHFASMQKLLDGLERQGVFQPARELPAFDTIVAPALED
jgi:hypothetical protein